MSEIKRYRHVKRGTVYEIVGRAELQVNNIALADGATMVFYRGEDGKLWVRGEAEFMDGRFVPDDLDEDEACRIVGEWYWEGQQQQAFDVVLSAIKRGRLLETSDRIRRKPQIGGK